MFLAFQVVNILYRENDWVYVIAADSRQEGFIPHSYCTAYNSHLGELALSNVKKKLPREQRNSSNGNSTPSNLPVIPATASTTTTTVAAAITSSGLSGGEAGVGESDAQDSRTGGAKSFLLCRKIESVAATVLLAKIVEFYCTRKKLARD